MSHPVFEDDPYYDDPKWKTPYDIGYNAYYDGSKCPYENESKEQYDWALGWRTADLHEIGKLDRATE